MGTNDKENASIASMMLGKMNLLKLKNARIISVQGEKGMKKGVFLPIEENFIYVSTDGHGQAKGAFFDFVCFRTNDLRYGNTHALKTAIPFRVRQNMSEEEYRSYQYFGNLHPPVRGYEATPMQTPEYDNPAVDNYPSATPTPPPTAMPTQNEQSAATSVQQDKQPEEQRAVKKPLKPLDWDDTDDLPF